MERKEGFFAKIKTRVGIIRVETNLEGIMVKGVAGKIKNKFDTEREVAKLGWESRGKNFMERLGNTAKQAGESIKEGWNRFRTDVGGAFNDLRERYQREGIAGATMGMVAEAVQTVGELPDRIGAGLNRTRAVIEEIKSELISDKRKKLSRGHRAGWRKEFDQLGLVRDHVSQRREVFYVRWQLCQDRLEAMAQGRQKLVVAKMAMMSATE